MIRNKTWNIEFSVFSVIFFDKSICYVFYTNCWKRGIPFVIYQWLLYAFFRAQISNMTFRIWNSVVCRVLSVIRNSRQDIGNRSLENAIRVRASVKIESYFKFDFWHIKFPILNFERLKLEFVITYSNVHVRWTNSNTYLANITMKYVVKAYLSLLVFLK